MCPDSQGAATYSYCPGPRAAFNLLENSENVKTVSQEVLDSKLVSASMPAIADVCNCGSDMVQAVLQLIRDEVVEVMQTRNKAVSLNLLIGTLTLKNDSV